MDRPIPIESILNKDAVEAARQFISYGDLQYIQDEWNGKGVASFPLSRGNFERIVKVLFVGMGELSK